MIPERQQKINNLILHTAKVHELFGSAYLKVPIELLAFSVSDQKISEVSTYLAGQFLFPGKVRTINRPSNEIANLIGLSERTVYRSLDWLLNRNWVGKDSKNGWLFFRGFNRLYQMEGWKYSRAIITREDHLLNFKAFSISAIITNAIKAGRDTGSEQTNQRSGPPRYPIPVSFFEKVFDVSRRTAIDYIKIAKKSGYVKKYVNFQNVSNLTPTDVHRLRKENIEIVDVQLSGNFEFQSVPVTHLRTDRGQVLLQGVNFFSSSLLTGGRRLPTLLSIGILKGEAFVNEPEYEVHQ